MPRFWRIVLAFLFVLAAKIGVAAASVSVLFVGNSLTQANDLPTVFKQFAAESSLCVDVDVRSITPGGATFYDHWKRGEALARLREQHSNFLVLQGQSAEPLFAPRSFSITRPCLKRKPIALAPKQFCFRPGQDQMAIRTIKIRRPGEIQPQCKRA